MVKAHELTRPGADFKKFRVKNGKVEWTEAHMNGDRKRVCLSRKENGVVKKRYVGPHTEMEVT
jgi:hypothetical protein